MRSWRAVRLVAMREIHERGRSRGYLLSLACTLVLLMAGLVLPRVLLAGDTVRVALVEPTPAGLVAAVKAAASASDLDLEVSIVPDRASAQVALAQARIDAALVVPADLSGPGELVVQKRLDPRLRAAMSAAVVSLRAADAAALLSAPRVTVMEPPSETDATAIIVANAGVILMFIGIYLYGSWVLTGVVEEKQSRVVEVVLSTVRPRDLLMGKVTGIGVLALVQLVVLAATVIGVGQLTGQLALPPTTAEAVVQLLVWFILGFALYSTAMGSLGSLVSRGEEASSVSIPVTMTATACYLVSILVVTREPAGLVARVMTFLPPSAPMVVPLRVALGAIEPWELALAVLLMLGGIGLLFAFGARVYSGAILQTGSRVRIRDSWRARS